MNLISIIVPVYNASESLYIAVESIKNQGLENVQVVFVNDCSIDNSLEVIASFSIELRNLGYNTIIHSHEVNKGVAAARNTGLTLATGEYIAYLDADDFLEPHALAKMINKAKQENADIVGCNWYMAFDKNKRKMKQPCFASPWEAIELMLCGVMRWNLWLFIVRRELYQTYDIKFEPGMNMGEDLMVTLKLFSHANKVAFVNEPLYNYNQMNASSLTKNYSEKNIEEVTWNVSEAERYLESSIYKERLGDLIAILKLNIKLPLLISSRKSDYVKWNQWFTESNKYAISNTKLSKRILLLQFMASKSQFWFVKLHYYIIIKFVYGIIYR